MKFYDVKITGYEVEAKIDAKDLTAEQRFALDNQSSYIVKGDYIVLGHESNYYRVFLSELIAVDYAGNSARLVESDGIDYVSLEEYIEGEADAYKWYEDWLDEREEREQEYWQDKMAEFNDFKRRFE